MQLEEDFKWTKLRQFGELGENENMAWSLLQFIRKLHCFQLVMACQQIGF